MRHTKAKSGEQGAVLVEMAFVLPVLALIFINIIDLGVIVREYQVLQNAAREAARFSAQPMNQMYAAGADAPTIQAAIEDFVINYAAGEKVTIARSNITIEQRYVIPGGACGSQITITYSRPLLLGAPLFPTNTMTLTGTAVFQNLYGC